MSDFAWNWFRAGQRVGSEGENSKCLGCSCFLALGHRTVKMLHDQGCFLKGSERMLYCQGCFLGGTVKMLHYQGCFLEGTVKMLHCQGCFLEGTVKMLDGRGCFVERWGYKHSNTWWVWPVSPWEQSLAWTGGFQGWKQQMFGLWLLSCARAQDCENASWSGLLF